MKRLIKHNVIFGKLFVLGIVAVGMILGSVFWLTDRINQIERGHTADIVELLVMETIDQVALGTADYAHWDFAYQLVAGNDPEAIHANLGSGATESELFDQLIILSPSLEVQYLFDGTEQPITADQFDPVELAPFLDTLRAGEPASYQTSYGVGRVGGTFAAIAVAWITPDNASDFSAGELPILVGTTLIDDDKLDAIASLTQGADYAIHQPLNSQLHPAVALSGPDGEDFAQLAWTPSDFGTALRTEVLPGIILVCLGIFGICCSAAFYFHKQSRLLDQAHKFASTDQLTGLLNRSGLNDVLSTTTIKPKINMGHVAIIFLDLNDFKKLNDEYGHKDGDRALKVTAQRLQASVRPSDYVVRLGGDEFICLVFDEDPHSAADYVAARVASACSKPIDFANHATILRPSIGVAVSNEGVDWDTLLNQADAAMYLAKRSKAEGPLYFNRDLSESLGATIDEEADVRRLERLG